MRQDREEPACYAYRSHVIQFKICCPETQTHTHRPIATCGPHKWSATHVLPRFDRGQTLTERNVLMGMHQLPYNHYSLKNSLPSSGLSTSIGLFSVTVMHSNNTLFNSLVPSTYTDTRAINDSTMVKASLKPNLCATLQIFCPNLSKKI